MTQAALSRRMTGDVEFGLDLIGRICEATEISFAYVVTGIRETPAPGGPDGGMESRLRESNSRPFHYKSGGTGDRIAEVVELRRPTPRTLPVAV